MNAWKELTILLLLKIHQLYDDLVWEILIYFMYCKFKPYFILVSHSHWLDHETTGKVSSAFPVADTKSYLLGNKLHSSLWHQWGAAWEAQPSQDKGMQLYRSQEASGETQCCTEAWQRDCYKSFLSCKN